MKWIFPAAIAALLAAGPVLAGAQLVLTDGRVLDGEEVRRDGDLYLLQQANGQVVPIPMQLVDEVRLGGPEPERPAEAEEEETKPYRNPRTGITYGAGPETVAGYSQKAPAVVNTGGPRQLAGPRVSAPTTSEQLKVFGGSAKFQKGVVNPHYTPHTDWDFSDQAGHNNWNPSHWSKGTVDPQFKPRSDWNEDPQKQNNFSPSSWSKAPIDSDWTPKSGFN